MKRALVVKALTDQIVLVRSDDGELISLLVSCRKLAPGSLLLLDVSSAGCVIHSVDGTSCASACRRPNAALIIEQKDDAPRTAALGGEAKRHAI